MVGKGYFAALIVVHAPITLNYNPAEIQEYDWVTANTFHERIANNPADKLAILHKAFSTLVGESSV
jgi:isopentenyldiphosphate isomerase